MKREHLSSIANHIGIEPDTARDFLEVARMCGYELVRSDSAIVNEASDFEVLARREQSAYEAGYEAGGHRAAQTMRFGPQLVKP